MTSSSYSLAADDALSIPSSKVRQDKKLRIVVRTPLHKLCLHCNGRLSIGRALFRSEFCSRAHDREYRRNIEELGLERLRLAAERIRAAAGRTEKVS
jgi:hypothetical protein